MIQSLEFTVLLLGSESRGQTGEKAGQTVLGLLLTVDCGRSINKENYFSFKIWKNFYKEFYFHVSCGEESILERYIR